MKRGKTVFPGVDGILKRGKIDFPPFEAAVKGGKTAFPKLTGPRGEGKPFSRVSRERESVGKRFSLRSPARAGQVGLHSYILVSLAFAAGTAATFMWWRSADQAR